MELKDFQQRVLDTLDSYLDELKSSQANYLKIVSIFRLGFCTAFFAFQLSNFV